MPAPLVLGFILGPWMEENLRRALTPHEPVDGFEILEGEGRDQGDDNVTHPDWPRYLQLVVDGEYRRIRLAWLEGEPPDPHQRVVIVSSGDLRVGLVVDQIIGSHQTVIKSLSRLHADVETFSGATILICRIGYGRPETP